MKKYLQLAAQIIGNGNLRHTGQDFNENRAKSLAELQEFIPSGFRNKLNTHASPKPKSSASNLIAQAAFIKSGFNNSGGHLLAENLGYIRIPKSANTSISYSMLVKQYPALKEKNPDEFQVNFLADVNLQAAKEATTEKFFTVVRNPFARLVSVYRDFFETNHGGFMYSDYLFRILDQKISFAEFVNRISRIPDRLKDQHFRPQYLFLEPYIQKGIEVKIFQLEERENLKSFLEEHGMELWHRNKSRDPYDYSAYYSPTLLTQVYDLYKTDIHTFNYDQLYKTLQARFAAN